MFVNFKAGIKQPMAGLIKGRRAFHTHYGGELPRSDATIDAKDMP